MSRIQALDAKQTANSLIIFFKEGLARTQSIRKSKRTEKALLLGCDESKLQQDWERSSSFSLDWNVYMLIKKVTEIKKGKKKGKQTRYVSLKH